MSELPTGLDTSDVQVHAPAIEADSAAFEASYFDRGTGQLWWFKLEAVAVRSYPDQVLALWLSAY